MRTHSIAAPCLPPQIVLCKSNGKLGISCIDNPDGPGVVCSALIEGSVAYHAGLNVGDIITIINGKQVRGHQDAIAAIDRAPDRVAFVLSRACRFPPHPPPFALAPHLRASPSRAGATRRVTLDKSRGRIGVTLSSPHIGSGVQVAALESKSLAFDAGLYVGDTILAVNGWRVTDHSDAVETIDDADHFVELVVIACTRELELRKTRGTKIGITLTDRLDGGAGVVVVGLQPGGAAIRMLELGDTLLSVEGSLVRSHAEAIEMIDSAPERVRMVVGARVADLCAVLDAVSHTSSVETPRHGYTSPGSYACGPPACDQPVFTRHQPLHEVQSNAFRPSVQF